ncbi:MAG: hypothetical protein AUJ88_00020 [Gallionellaceae bacterium CG1_02_56_997]|nr:MAG: hypothetical protein AUJ88_00020 [Gallionellaceae bacterium CG1_02_56_997]
MSELTQLIRSLVALSWRYSTFRGSWTEMPNSTGLYVFLGATLYIASTITAWIEYGEQAAALLPPIMIASIYFAASNGGTAPVNKRLIAAIFLLITPVMVALALVGRGHLFIEALAGLYIGATVITLMERK